jgi:hypothetical protein
MEYLKYRIKDRFYKVYFTVYDKKELTTTMVPTIDIMVEYFKETHDIDMTIDELKKARDNHLDMKVEKYQDFYNRFKISMRTGTTKKSI